jgi:DNA-binding response OmpR family regulator
MTFDVLLVTSLPREAVLVGSLVEQHGFHLLTVRSAAAAERTLRVDAVDAIIVDEYLPDGGWHDVVRMATVQATCPPVIVVATGIENADREDAQAAGAFDLIARPITSEVILTQLYRACTMACTGHRSILINNTVEMEVGV